MTQEQIKDEIKRLKELRSNCVKVCDARKISERINALNAKLIK
jgi:hypothetical protein